MATDTAQQERCAENQSLFRDLNERLNALSTKQRLWMTMSEWVCECADETCSERIEMTLQEYQELRENSTHFAVGPDDRHVLLDVERIVEKGDRYWVVEKVELAAVVAEQLDPRSNTTWSE